MGLIKIDFRFLNIFHELYALKQFISSIESQLPTVIEQETQKAHENLRAKEYEDSDRQDIEQRLYDLINNVLPRYFWSSIFVILWAIFESGILEAAKEAKSPEGQNIPLPDIPSNFLKKANKLINDVFGFQLRGLEGWKKLQMYYVLRNAIVHANGRIESIKSEKDINNILGWGGEKNSGIDVSTGSIIFTPEFIKEAYQVMFDFLIGVTETLKNQYPFE